MEIRLCSRPLQDVFPTDFGPEYDGALQMLMLDFLSRLEKLLPVPDIQQVLETGPASARVVKEAAALVLWEEAVCRPVSNACSSLPDRLPARRRPVGAGRVRPLCPRPATPEDRAPLPRPAGTL